MAQAAGGYGAGYGALRELHEQFVSSLLELRDKRKMTIVLIGHVETERCSPPDSEEYMRYTPQLTKTNNVDTSKVYTNKVDLCAFISYGAFVEKNGLILMVFIGYTLSRIWLMYPKTDTE